MKMVRYLCLVLLVAAACISPPVYDTAIAHAGLSIGAGVGYQSASRAATWVGEGAADWSFVGVRPDFLMDYGVSKTFSMHARFGAFITPDIHWEGDEPDDDRGDISIPLPMIGVGFKFSSPPTDKVFNAAMGLDIDFPNIASLTPMIGFSTKTRHEFLTLGFQTTNLLLPQTVFMTIHPFKGAHIYGSADFFPFQQQIQDLIFDGDPVFGSFSVGLAYTHNTPPKAQNQW